MPSMNNSDYTLSLDKNLFQLDEDVVLKLEVMEGKWSFLSDRSYRIKKAGVLFENQPLQADDLLSIVVRDKVSLSLLVCDREQVFTAYQKYDISAGKEITIGKSADNMIQYTFREFVSKKHASIICKDRKWSLIDTSTNGV